MCKVLDEVEAKGIEKGIEKGIAKGRDNTLFELVHDGLLDIQEAARRAGKTVKTFKKEMNKMYS